MKKIFGIFMLSALLLALPATVLASGTALDRALQAGWQCDNIAGAMHCFDPGDGPRLTALRSM